jgi:hypothetical protein
VDADGSAHRYPSAAPAPQIPSVHTTSVPPYALPALEFPCRHLAALAGRAPIGGAREVALACFLAARLATAWTREPLAGDLSADRGAGARSWLATLALPAPIRVPLARCLECVGAGSAEALTAALVALSEAAAPFLDPASRAELDQIAARLTG